MAMDEAVAYATRGRGRRGERAAYGWGSLTPTERQVVDLVAQGLTNREIGEALFMSPRTAATHVSHALAKLGVASRKELAKLAVQRAP